MPLITVDQDRLDVADFDNAGGWNSRIYRSFTSTIRNGGQSNNNNNNSGHPNNQQHHQHQHQHQQHQQHQQQSYVLANLNTAEEEDMSVMTVDTVFRTSSNMSSTNLSEMAHSGNRGAMQTASPSAIGLSTDTSSFNISESTSHNNLSQRGGGGGGGGGGQSHRRERQSTSTTLTATTPEPQRRYSTQTYSNRSIVRSSIHSSHHNGTTISSNESHSNHSHSNNSHSLFSHYSQSGSVQRRIQPQIYGSSRSRAKAVAIYPQPKTRRRRQTLSVDDSSINRDKPCHEEDIDDDVDDAATAANDEESDEKERRRNRVTGTVDAAIGETVPSSSTTNNIHSTVPITQPPTVPKTSVVDRQRSTKTLATSNHSLLTTCASTATNTCNGGNGTTMAANSADGYHTRIEGEIVHLSLELATTKSNLDQANMIIRDYKRQADQFESLVEILQNEINTLRDKLAEGNGAAEGATGVVGLSTVDEGTNSLEGLPSGSGGSGGAQRMMKMGERERERETSLPLTLSKVMGGTTADRNISLTNPATGAAISTMSKILSYTSLDVMAGGTSPATGAAISTMSKILSYASLDAVVGGTFPDRSMIATQKNEDLNLPRSVTTAAITATTPITTPTPIASRSTIGQRKSFTSDEIDAMVEDAAQRRRQKMDCIEEGGNNPTTAASASMAEIKDCAITNDIDTAITNDIDTNIDTDIDKNTTITGCSVLEETQALPQTELNNATTTTGDNCLSAAQMYDVQGDPNNRTKPNRRPDLIKDTSSRSLRTASSVRNASGDHVSVQRSSRDHHSVRRASGDHYSARRASGDHGSVRRASGDHAVSDFRLTPLCQSSDNQNGEVKQLRNSSTSTITSNGSCLSQGGILKSAKMRKESDSGETIKTRYCSSESQGTKQGGDVGSDTEVFQGDPFATVNGYNDDGLEILDQIAAVLNYDLVKSPTKPDDQYNLLDSNQSNKEDQLVVSSIWSSMFRKRRSNDTHSRQQHQVKPVKKSGIFGF